MSALLACGGWRGSVSESATRFSLLHTGSNLFILNFRLNVASSQYSRSSQVTFVKIRIRAQTKFYLVTLPIRNAETRSNKFRQFWLVKAGSPRDARLAFTNCCSNASGTSWRCIPIFSGPQNEFVLLQLGTNFYIE